MNLFVRRRDTDALLNGEPLSDDSDLGDVEAFLADMRLEFGALPAPEPRPTLAATLDGRRELRPASGPTPKPTFPPAKPKSHALRPVAVVFATGAVLFGGLASAGALPGPAQRAAARIGSTVGLHLPGEATTPVDTKVHVGPATTTDNDGTGGAGRTGGRTTPSGAATSSTSVPGTSPTTAATPGAPAVPTTPTTPNGAVAPTVPTVPTVPTLPKVYLPQPPLPDSPLKDLIDPTTGSILSPKDATP